MAGAWAGRIYNARHQVMREAFEKMPGWKQASKMKKLGLGGVPSGIRIYNGG